MLKNKAEKYLSSQPMKINDCLLKTYPKVRYFYCLGKNTNEQLYKNKIEIEIENIVVIIHGISRNAKEIISSFSNTVNNNTLLIAPLFSKKYATDYQRLGRKNKGPRADYILQAIVNELQEKYQSNCRNINLFGFSAGAQFAQRYAFAHPNHINKVAIVAAGWYTMPSLKLSYPFGLKLKDEFNDIEFDLQRLLRVKFRVYIGEKDYFRDKSLNINKRIDALQGLNRIERAKNWITHMESQFNKYHINNQINLVELHGVTHDFNDANNQAQLSNKIYSWFFKANLP
ncbi:MAG: alpha/beta hydrolase [Alcanivoracaceae bacterium]|nr:alpha/beta hydrolase [Alcanivoracaceae bacterium]